MAREDNSMWRTRKRHVVVRRGVVRVSNERVNESKLPNLEYFPFIQECNTTCYVDGNLAKVITLPNNSSGEWFDLVDGLNPATTVNVSGIYITDPITLTWNTLPRFEQIAYRFGVDGTILGQPPINTNQRRLDIYGDSMCVPLEIRRPRERKRQK
eukprot:m.91423 g.91423  ORF g.91423 m.91423 type:complete len:155 (-) comp26467_c0_seq6:6-470(-)